jgi:hypothetical protein
VSSDNPLKGSLLLQGVTITRSAPSNLQAWLIALESIRRTPGSPPSFRDLLVSDRLAVAGVSGAISLFFYLHRRLTTRCANGYTVVEVSVPAASSLPRIGLIRTSFHRGAAEIAEGARRIGFSLRSLGVLRASAVCCSSLSICCRIRQDIHQYP